MSDLLLTLSSIMRAEVDSLNAISQNASNVNASGYKAVRKTITPDSFHQSITGTTEVNLKSSTKVDQSHGTLKITERPLDLALIGDAWFGVQHKDGVYLTRRGIFQLNENGVLVTEDGYPIIGKSGPIQLNSSAVTVNAQGVIVDQDGVSEELALFKINKNASVEAKGSALYKVSSFYATNENSESKVIQGAIENSNVDIAADMVRLMETTRHIESVQRAMTTYNELLNVGINQLGK